MKAIIVDDNPRTRVIIRNLLENAGITVSFEATDGAEALKLITATQPDIAILDTDIPILSGIKVTEILRKKRYDGIIVVVADKNAPFYGKRSVNAGANAFINKKESIRDIISAIEAAQNGYCYFPFH